MSAARANTQDERRAAPLAAGEGFGALVGQDRIVRALRHAIEHDRLPHALLFGGPPGVGKATCAGLLAQALNCPERGPLDACGTCPSCRKIARGYHPDVLWIEPDPRIIRIGQVTYRDSDPKSLPRTETATGFVGYTPYEGQRRIVIIDQAHTMNPSAQNALLKTLEEPPASALVILVSPAPGTLLPTVRSRCQSLRFAPVPLPDVRAHLELHHDMDPEEARLRAALAPGSIGAAIAVDLETYAELLEAVVDALRLAIAGGAGIVAAADQLAASGEGETATQRAAATLYVARDVLRDLLVVSSGGDRGTLVNIDRLEAWEAWAAEVDAEDVAEALAAVNVGIERFTTGITPNIKMAFELTLSDVFRALSPDTQAVGSMR